MITGREKQLKMKLRKQQPKFRKHGYYLVFLDFGWTSRDSSCLGEFKVYSTETRKPVTLYEGDGCIQQPIFRFHKLQFQWGMIDSVHRHYMPERYYYGDLEHYVLSMIVLDIMDG